MKRQTIWTIGINLTLVLLVGMCAVVIVHILNAYDDMQEATPPASDSNDSPIPIQYM
jgi:flagellar biosynthesis protein FliQ